MFERILFPTDFSAYANAVFACLPELKVAGTRHVHLLAVIGTAQVPLGHTAWNEDSLARVKWSMEEQLYIAAMALQGQGLSTSTQVVYGNPAREIVRVAQEERVDMIVMGAQGQSAFQEILLGNTAFDVLRMSPVPVLVEKFEVVRELGKVECRRVCGEMFCRVLHPTDFSDCANVAFSVVKRLRGAGTKEVLLLHVQDERVMRRRPPEQLEQFDREDAARLDRMARDLALYHLPARPILRHGLPHVEALKVAEEEDVSLIALSVCGRNVLDELLVGSTFEKIVRLSQRPVLAVRCEPVR